MASSIIEVRDVHVTFREGWLLRPVRALEGLSFSVHRGDIFGLLGPNGAGKSTALHCLLALIRPDRGSIRVMGETPEPGHGIFEEIVYLPEEPDFHENLKIREALSLYVGFYDRSPTGEEVDRALKRVDLWEARHRTIKNCSKGMKQRFGIAICFVRSPELVFLDEPTRGLDPLMVRRFRRHLLELNEQGSTIFLNSHVFSEIEMICNRVAIMAEGTCLVEDSLRDLREIDHGQYMVELADGEDVPSYLEGAEERSGRLVARCPSERLGDLVAFCEDRDRTLYEISLGQLTLEQVFENVLEGEGLS